LDIFVLGHTRQTKTLATASFSLASSV
jgi:hypothetical protein